MFLRITIAAFIALILAGCATTTPTPKNQAQQLQNQVKELQDKITFLEQELQIKSKEISELESELERTRIIEHHPRQETAPIINLSIRQIQIALKNAGFYRGVIDGKSGTQTKSAIEQFQKAHGLKVDGIVGTRTALALTNYLNK